MTFRRYNNYVLGAVVAAVMGAVLPAYAADGTHYGFTLDPMPFDNSTVKNNVGSGSVSADLTGSTLVISGTYTGLSSNATAAHLLQGPAMGVSGPEVGSLKVSGGMSGTISGTVQMSATQLAAFRKGGASIVIDTEKAADGSIRGFFPSQTSDFLSNLHN